MSEEKKKMDLFQLLAIIIIVGSVFMGLYYTNMVVMTRFDTMETVLSSNTKTLERIIDQLDQKVQSLETAAKESAASNAAPAQPAKEEAAAEGEAAVAEGEANDEEAKTGEAKTDEAKTEDSKALAKADKKAE